MKRRNYTGDQGVGGGILLKWIFNKREVRAWSGYTRLRIQKSGRHLQTL